MALPLPLVTVIVTPASGRPVVESVTVPRIEARTGTSAKFAVVVAAFVTVTLCAADGKYACPVAGPEPTPLYVPVGIAVSV